MLLDAQRLLAQIRALGAIGHDPAQGGRTRIALTDDEKAGRDQLVHWMRELNLDVHIDRVGNIFGILHAASAAGGAQPLMKGSHIDTVRNAGALDGCYGVLAGLAVARAYRQADVLPRRAIVVGAFTNEEGVRYQPDMMGSLVLRPQPGRYQPQPARTHGRRTARPGRTGVAGCRPRLPGFSLTPI